SGHGSMQRALVFRVRLWGAWPAAVFSGPSADQIDEGTKRFDGGAGVVHIVNNYTGDVLNFEMAAELAQADGVEVRSVVIDDDVALQDSLYTAGRGGVGTSVLAENIAGARGEEGGSVGEVADVVSSVNAGRCPMGRAHTA